MLQRLDAMESELGALIESLRTGSEPPECRPQLLEGNLGEVREAVGAPSRGSSPRRLDAREPARPSAARGAGRAGRGRSALRGRSGARRAEPEEPQPAHERRAGDELAEPEPVERRGRGAASPDGAADDTEGARLIALNMALNGTPREETDRYLAENFELDDRDGLLDEVYASRRGLASPGSESTDYAAFGAGRMGTSVRFY